MIKQPYIYALTYKGIISYVGLHCGNDKYYFSGGIIPKRMGKDKFIKGVIEYCKEEDLENLEMFYIKKYNPKFNLTTGGERSSIGTKHTKETIKKRKESFLSNIKHIEIITERMKIQNKINNPCIKTKIKCLNDNLIFSSIREAGRHYNIDNSCVAKHLKGRYDSVKGLRFIPMEL